MAKYLDYSGLTYLVGKIKTLLNGKQNSITGAASTITGNNLTASRALVSDANGKVIVSDITATELNYLNDVTSNIQTQLNAKQDSNTTIANATTASKLGSTTVGATNQIIYLNNGTPTAGIQIIVSNSDASGPAPEGSIWIKY